jgi:hypothetical protein
MNEQPRSGRHQVSIGHLVMGFAFLGIVGIWALVQSDTVTGDDIRWLLPIPWVVAGIVGLVATAITGPRRYAVRQSGWVGSPPDENQLELSDETEPDPETSVEETAPLNAQKQDDPEEKP